MSESVVLQFVVFAGGASGHRRSRTVVAGLRIAM